MLVGMFHWDIGTPNWSTVTVTLYSLREYSISLKVKDVFTSAGFLNIFTRHAAFLQHTHSKQPDLAKQKEMKHLIRNRKVLPHFISQCRALETNRRTKR